MKKSYTQRIARCCVGLVIFSFGVYLTVQANRGLAPWDVFSMGLAQKIAIPFGSVVVAISVLVVGIDLLLRERIGLGTLLDTVIVGNALNVWTSLDFSPIQDHLGYSIALLMAGLLIMGYGQYLYISTGLCCGPRDSLLVALGRRMKKMPIGAVDIGIQVTVFLIGVLLGGPIGIGTVLSVFCNGIAMQLVFRIARFEPREVVHESLWDTFQRIRRLGNR